jgi:hypothetical protein
MFTALASLMLNRPVRHDVAMTGEITLRGLVLPIGGLKEKTLAALRAGIKQVIVPKRNEKDLPDIPQEVSGNLVDSFNQSLSSTGIQEDDISFTPAADISSVTVVPTSISDGFNNISFEPADEPAATDVPEPAAISVLAVSTLLLGRRGSRKQKAD